eukprot:8466560-Pyramimonas_sp.AAC.1
MAPTSWTPSLSASRRSRSGRASTGVGGTRYQQAQEELEAAKAAALASKPPDQQTQSLNAQLAAQRERLAGTQRGAEWRIEKVKSLAAKYLETARKCTEIQTEIQQLGSQLKVAATAAVAKHATPTPAADALAAFV